MKSEFKGMVSSHVQTNRLDDCNEHSNENDSGFRSSNARLLSQVLCEPGRFRKCPFFKFYIVPHLTFEVIWDIVAPYCSFISATYYFK